MSTKDGESHQTVTPALRSIDLNALYDQATAIMNNLDEQKVASARFKNGTTYNSTPKKRTLVGNGVVVEQSPGMTTITIATPHHDSNSDRLDVRNPSRLTQAQAGAYHGVSQPTVSRRENKVNQRRK